MLFYLDMSYTVCYYFNVSYKCCYRKGRVSPMQTIYSYMQYIC